MAERLGVVKLAPAAILDAGCGTGVALGELHARYPDARLIGLDLAYNMALAARRRAAAVAAGERSLLGRLLGSRRATPDLRPRLLCGDLCRSPLKAACVELVWSNLTLQWVNSPQLAFAEFHRVLAVGGLVSFTTLGPDTLRELRTAFAAADAATHVSRFIDMHDPATCSCTRFRRPGDGYEMLTLTYADASR
jgi:malonyl-CoA O-methyltransferase